MTQPDPIIDIRQHRPAADIAVGTPRATFRWLWIGQAVSESGSAITAIAVPLMAISLLHVPTFQISLLAASTMAAPLMWSIPGGWLVDRSSKRWIMILCDAGRLAVVGSVPVSLYLLDTLTYIQLVVVAATEASLALLFGTAYQSYLPFVFPLTDLLRANRMVSLSTSIAMSLGPSVGGVLVGSIGAARTVIVDCASYVVSIGTVLLIGRRSIHFDGVRSQVNASPTDWIAGLRFVKRDRLVWRIVLSNSLSTLFRAVTTTLWLPYVIRDLGWSSEKAGFVLGVGALGGVIGGLLLPRVTRLAGEGRVLLASQGVAPICMAVTPCFGTLKLAPVLIGLGFVALVGSSVIYNALQRTIRQQRCPRDLLGRMNAAVRLIQGAAMPIGALGAGVLASAFGVRATLFVAAAGCICAYAVLAAPRSVVRDGDEIFAASR